VLPDKLEGMVAAVIAAAPSLQREQAVHFLLHTARGRNVAQHLASITKTEREHPVPQVNIFKLHNPDSVKEIAKSIISGEVTGVSFHDVLMGHARLSKRDGETDAKAYLEKRHSENSNGAGIESPIRGLRLVSTQWHAFG
jgi:hypothetical protein